MISRVDWLGYDFHGCAGLVQRLGFGIAEVMALGFACLAALEQLAAGFLKRIHVLTMGGDLAWFDVLSASYCGSELIQAQCGFFGHHDFEYIGQAGRWHIT